ncbi:hypothetical protein CSV63_02925 [Sporosarcina sp. P34]|uniref:hypothetical protein n=1 Tax=Sporosarcina sp. P34 TaxID=2048247 RepID=UPI000C164C24|nr:hypothetical protein [Sporosarcina sp. P34]PID16858.1 hypothetical protein CSV63_02925 [Sporosarcina sp. P34]
MKDIREMTKGERLKFIADHHTRENGIVYGEWNSDDYFIIERNDKLYVVHSDYFGYTSAVLFAVGGDDHRASDWSDGMLLDATKEVVDSLNVSSRYPFGGDDDNA